MDVQGMSQRGFDHEGISVRGNRLTGNEPEGKR